MEELINATHTSLKGVLELIKREFASYKMCYEMAIEYSEMIDEETQTKGISFDEKIPQASINVTPYVNELIHKQASYEIEAQKHLNNAYSLMKTHYVSRLMNKLNQKEKELIEEAYINGVPIRQIALDRQVSQKNTSVKISNIIRKMAENYVAGDY